MIGMCYKCHTSNTRVLLDMGVGLHICGPCKKQQQKKKEQNAI